LESVFGIVVVVENPAARAPNHRAMPPHQGGEGRFVPMLEEVPQELPIGQSRPIAQQHGPAQVLENLAHLARRPVAWVATPLPLWAAPPASTLTITGRGMI